MFTYWYEYREIAKKIIVKKRVFFAKFSRWASRSWQKKVWTNVSEDPQNLGKKRKGKCYFLLPTFILRRKGKCYSWIYGCSLNWTNGNGSSLSLASSWTFACLTFANWEPRSMLSAVSSPHTFPNHIWKKNNFNKK